MAEQKKDLLSILKKTKRNIDAVGRKGGDTRVRNGRTQRWNSKSGKWITISKQTPTKSGSGSGLSEAAQSNLKMGILSHVPSNLT